MSTQTKTRINAVAFKPYVEADWTLIPLRGKAPVDSKWTTKVYDSRTVVQDAIATDSNVGVRPTAEQVIIDVDPRNGGTESLARLIAKTGFNPDKCPTVETGGGGAHLYMRLPPGVSIRKNLPAFPGLDFITLGAQAVAAGSVHPETGRHYTWDEFALVGLSDAPMAPPGLLALLTRADAPTAPVGPGRYTPEGLAEVLTRLEVTDFREHDKWLRLAMACHHATRGEGKEVFIEWSTSDPEYNDHDEVIAARWESFNADKDGGITENTLDAILAEHCAADAIPPRTDAADDFPDAPPIVADALEITSPQGLLVGRGGVALNTYDNARIAIRKAALAPAWNELDQNVEFRTATLPWKPELGSTLTDLTAIALRDYLMARWQNVRFEPSKEHIIEAAKSVALENHFNPVLEYLDGLTWDGAPRVASLFGEYLNCGDSELARAMSSAFMVAAVRRMRQPGTKFDTVPILISPQGWNKSTALRVLFGDAWFTDGDLGNLHSKDAALILRGKWCIEFAELESMSRAESGVLKAFVSRAVDRLRLPYDRLSQDSPRRCVFVGTCNETGFLKDSTGARRFWPLTLRDRIDLTRLRADRDRLWAEAAALERRGASVELPRALWGEAAKLQAEQTTDDPWTDLIGQFLARREREHADFQARQAIGETDIDDLAPPPDKVLTAELFEALHIAADRLTKDQAQRIRTIMEYRVKWKYRPGVRVLDRRGRGYIKQ